MKENKTSYKDIIIYTIAIMLILFLREFKIISYSLLVTLLVISLATFALYNLRAQLKRLFSKKKN